MSDSGVQPYNPAMGVGFKVIGVHEGPGKNATGNYVNGRQVMFQLKGGTTGSVFVSDADWNEDTVRAALQQAATVLQNVSMMQQGM
jgi:hypothetical protein